MAKKPSFQDLVSITASSLIWHDNAPHAPGELLVVPAAVAEVLLACGAATAEPVAKPAPSPA